MLCTVCLGANTSEILARCEHCGLGMCVPCLREHKKKEGLSPSFVPEEITRLNAQFRAAIAPRWAIYRNIISNPKANKEAAYKELCQAIEPFREGLIKRVKAVQEQKPKVVQEVQEQKSKVVRRAQEVPTPQKAQKAQKQKPEKDTGFHIAILDSLTHKVYQKGRKWRTYCDQEIPKGISVTASQLIDITCFVCAHAKLARKKRIAK